MNFNRSTFFGLIRFAASGAFSFLLTMGVTSVLHEVASLPTAVAAALGLVVAASINFLVLRFFVFKGTRRPFMTQLVTFLAASGIFRGIEYSGFLLLHFVVGVNYLVSLGAMLFVSFFLKFVSYDRWLFKRAD